MIYTGNFCHVQQYEQAGLTPVSIAGHAPDYYKGIQFKILAPKYTWWKEWHDKHLSNDWYRAKYQETVLNKLNPKVIANRLQSFGDDIVLLCYERPSDFCHRQLVADWFCSSGIPVYEYEIALSQELFTTRDNNLPR